MNSKYTSSTISNSSITINGKTYTSLDEVPEDQKENIRELMEFKFQDLSDGQTLYEYNGTTYESFEDMPQEAQEFWNNMPTLSESLLDKEANRSFLEEKVKQMHNRRFNSTTISDGTYSKQPVEVQAAPKVTPQKARPASQTDQASQYTSAVQKTNTKYGWVGVVVIVGVVTAVCWKAFT
ncbi:hypothetical protein [Kangiella spongicola]|uniref:Uncharacterized protein n=1 Tax=Kangiella spongicola TaxID=796379 RepID=A0A318D3V7_9GAMM|nr:hypothetical protein [Kangiella spongicola]PXF63631.1 hypothetical protein DL796_00295 [Kangiella spongicola]